MTPLRHLWETAGCPAPNWQGKARRPVTPPTPRDGVCAVTGERGPVWPLSKVSTTITTVDQFRFRDVDPDGLALGPVAAWAFRHRAAMQQPHAVVDGVFRDVQPSEIAVALARLAEDPCALVSVPQSRQKHTIPWVQWGTVAVDAERLPWSAPEQARLDVYGRLRGLGFGETALTEPVPRWPILTKLDSGDRAAAVGWWPALDPWRAHPSYLDIAARATRKDP